MLMDDAEIRELVRARILDQLEAASGFGLGAGVILRGLRCAGFHHLEELHIRRELQYLVDKGLVADVAKRISPEVRRWRITAEGRDLLASGGA